MNIPDPQKMRMEKAKHRVTQSRRNGIFKDLSERTLNVMEEIVKADIQYDIDNGIEYES
jgi:hypothetical protein